MALLGGMLFWLNEEEEDGGALRRVLPVARLVDGDAIALVHLPDLSESGLAFERADFVRFEFHGALNEALKRIAPTTLELAPWAGHWERWQAMKVSHLSVALTERDGEHEILTFFQSEAPSERLVPLVQATWCPATSLPVKTSPEKLGDIYYHYLGAESAPLVYARKGKWHLVAADRAIIDRALQRLATEVQVGSLSEQSLFADALGSLRDDYQMLVYAKPSRSQSQKLEFFESLPGEALAISFSVDLQGRLQEDVGVVSRTLSETQEVKADFGAVMRLTSSDALFYAALGVGGREAFGVLFDPLQQHWRTEEFSQLHGLAESWESHFSETISLAIEPLADSERGAVTADGALTFILARGLVDGSRIQEQLEILAATPSSGIVEGAATTYAISPEYVPPVLEKLVDAIYLRVANGLLIMSDRREGISQAERRWEENAPVSASNDHVRLLSALPKPSAGLLYLDTPRLLDRGQEMLYHPLMVATLWLGRRGQSDLMDEFAKMQLVRQPHVPMHPTLATWQRTSAGWHQASIGTLSPLQCLLGGSALVSALSEAFVKHPSSEPGSDFFPGAPLD